MHPKFRKEIWKVHLPVASSFRGYIFGGFFFIIRDVANFGFGLHHERSLKGGFVSKK